jgi:signal transduction histidine kinase
MEQAGPTRADKGPLNVLKTGVPELYPELLDADLERVARSPAHLAFLRAVGPKSVLVVPLAARSRVFGTMTFLQTTSERRFAKSDLAFAQDLAARVALALDNARLYARLRVAVKTRDEVLSVVSHDLRNPLAAINAAASLAMRGLDAVGSPEATRTPRRNLELVRRTALRMSALIERLLDIARLDVPESLDVRPHEPESLVREAVELEQPLAIAKRIALVSQTRGPLPPIVADRERLNRVFENLVGNAIKFTPEGGRIIVSAELAGDAVSFAVTDTGPGIAKTDMEHVFERYWRAKRTPGVGAGLGLAIAKAIVQAHGGEIRVENLPEGGARFSFTIPCERIPHRRAA